MSIRGTRPTYMRNDTHGKPFSAVTENSNMAEPKYDGETASVFDAYLIRQIDVPRLALAEAAGDPIGARLFKAVGALHSGSPECDGCATPLRPGRDYTFVAALPSGGKHLPAFALVICERCGTEPKFIMAKGVSALRKVFPHVLTIGADA
jgi:hypothetical protein